MRIRNTAPFSLGPRLSVPPMRDTAWRTSTIPRPVPRSLLVVKNGSKIRCRSEADTPGPLSRTEMRASPEAVWAVLTAVENYHDWRSDRADAEVIDSAPALAW